MNDHMFDWRASCALLVLSGVVGCVGPAPEDLGPQGSVGVDINALTLPGVDNACWTLSVQAADGSTVWSQPGICADTYGDGVGSVTFVGPCDASSNDNVVSIVLEDLFDSAGAPLTDYANPCPASSPCSQTVTCVENEDQYLEFNVSVLRSAEVGFLDIAVNFEELRCSAKFDCQDDAGDPLDILHDPQSGDRVPSMVAAVSCVSPNPSAAIYLSDLEVVCDGVVAPVSFTISPGAGPGRHDFGPSGPPAGLTTASTFLTRSVVGSAPDDLTQVSAAVVMALDLPALDALGASSCRAQMRGTTSHTPLIPAIDGGYIVPPEYPVITWDVLLVDRSTGPLASACFQHPVGGADGAVSTLYTSAAGDTLDHAFE